MKKTLPASGLMLAVLTVLVGACGPPEDSSTPLPTSSTGTALPLESFSPLGDLTVEQASDIIGLPIPVPEYLPPGYTIGPVQIENTVQPPGPYWHIEMTVSGPTTSRAMTLSTVGGAPGMKMPPGAETVIVNASKAWVNRSADETKLTWVDKYGRMDSLEAGTEVQFDELVRTAESVTSPPTRAIEFAKPDESSLLIMRGDSQDIAFHLKNNSTKNVDVSFALDSLSRIPEDISVSVNEESLTLKPLQQADITAKVAVGESAVSPTYSHPSASSILSTDSPPPFSGAETEQASYYLSFVLVSYYPAGDVTVREGDGFSCQLRIDPPPNLPAGMVSLEDAQAAADFPVAMLLPEYVPAGTEPPPVGYGVGAQEPYVITAYYSSFSVVLSPEPGVEEAPADFAGQRDTIRNRPVVIGSNRIDWWEDDIHRTVVSDVLPMSELRLVAESMMLVGIYSGSWIGVK